MFNLFFFFIYSLIIFGVSLIGIIISKKNFILILICLELMFIAVNINLAMSGLFFDDITPHIFFMFTLLIAGSEASIGLGLLVAYYYNTQSSNIESMYGLKG